MKITKVTLTGADESIDPVELARLSIEYPFVEWGILLSEKSVIDGRNRFPGIDWRQELMWLHKESNSSHFPINIAGHLCGTLVKEFLMGNAMSLDGIKGIWEVCDRIQINTHGEPHTFNAVALSELIQNFGPQKEYIFQFDNVNGVVYVMHERVGLKVSALFDLSHGTGILPCQWPMPIKGMPCGYAGGLSPDNVEDQIMKLNGMLPDETSIWIDMETHLRSKQDTIFDLKKCEQVLKICQPYITTRII